MQIGQVAKQVGITVETVRFYEKKKLIAPPERNKSGYRDYSEDAVQRLLFIKRSKELGFSLKEIKELMFLRYDPATTCGDVRHHAVTKIKQIDKKIVDLQKIRTALERLASSCSGEGPVSSCPIIDALDN